MNDNSSNPAVRMELAIQELTSTRLLGTGISDDEIFHRRGYASSYKFWLAALSRPRSLNRFIRLIEIFSFRPDMDDSNQAELLVRMRLVQALNDMRLQRPETFFNNKTINTRLAAEILVDMPLIADLVPGSLREFFEGKPPEPAAHTPEASAGDDAVPQKPNIPKKELREFLNKTRDELGRVPAKRDSYILAVKHFPKHNVTRVPVEEEHLNCFGKQRPGPRSN